MEIVENIFNYFHRIKHNVLYVYVHEVRYKPYRRYINVNKMTLIKTTNNKNKSYMKTFTYNRSQLVNNNTETVKANIKKLNNLVYRTWMFRYDKIHGESGYARVDLNKYTGLVEYSQNVNTMSVEVGHICDWIANVEVKYNESNDMYFINFAFKTYKRNKYDSCVDYKFKESDSMVLCGKFDEFTLAKINLALREFESTVKSDLY